MEMGLPTFSTQLGLHLVPCALVAASASHAAGAGKSKLEVKVDRVSGTCNRWKVSSSSHAISRQLCANYGNNIVFFHLTPVLS
jgi:hypothetical protein